MKILQKYLIRVFFCVLEVVEYFIIMSILRK